MKHMNCYALLWIACLSGALTSCSTRAVNSENQSAENVENRLPVDVKIVREEPVRQEEIMVGTILPYREVIIMSEVSKKVTSVNFQDGSYVKAGQLLYSLDNSDILARIKQNSAELSLAMLNENRLGELLKSESVSREDYDIALTKLRTLEAVGELLEAELKKTLIHAPFSGIAGITKVECGALVTPGMPLVVLQEQGMAKIQFSVPEKHLVHIHKGKEINFITSSSPQRITAKITASEPGLDMSNRSATVQAVAENPGGQLKGGMSAKVYFSTMGEGAKGISIPTQALIPGESGYNVFVVKNGHAQITPVSLNNRNKSEAVILSGLNDGDTIMVSNILRASDGLPVQTILSK